jgi:hypothetical protein
MIVPLSFQDLNTNDAGMVAEADLMKLFQDKIDSYYGLEEQYQEDELEQAA